MSTTTQLDLRGVRVSVEFTHSPGCESSMSGPAEPEGVELQSVMVIGSTTDIIALLDEPCYEELQQLALERWKYNSEVARDDAADHRREEARLS